MRHLELCGIALGINPYNCEFCLLWQKNQSIQAIHGNADDAEKENYKENWAPDRQIMKQWRLKFIYLNVISAIFRQNGGDDFATENFKESAFLAESSNSSIWCVPFYVEAFRLQIPMTCNDS